MWRASVPLTASAAAHRRGGDVHFHPRTSARTPPNHSHHRFVRVLAVLAVRLPKLEAARVAQRAHGEVHLDGLPSDDRPLGGPVRLQGREDVMTIQALVKCGVYLCDIANQQGVPPSDWRR